MVLSKSGGSDVVNQYGDEYHLRRQEDLKNKTIKPLPVSIFKLNPV
jgi:hypothetical protein